MEQTFQEQEVLRRVRRELYLTEGLSAMDDESLRTLIRKILLRQNPDHEFSAEELARFVDTLYGNFRGLGILEEYLNDDTVSEIMINAWDVLFIERGGVVERSKDRITMRTLVEYGTLSEEAAEFLERLVKAKYNIFISGGTSSGKTTFLNALSDYIPKSERIITIEDSAELQLTGIDNLVRLETRNSNTTGSGEITIRDLIRTSLRMRPERIIVGEVRGEEALDMLGAMNTGHDGSLSTGHANSCEDMLRRLETMVMTGSSGLPLPAVRRNIASSIDLIVHLGRLSTRRRVVLEITEVVGLEGEEIILNRLYEQREGELVPTGNELIHTWKQEVYGHETTPHPRTVRPRKLDADGELPLGEPDPDDPYFFF